MPSPSSPRRPATHTPVAHARPLPTRLTSRTAQLQAGAPNKKQLRITDKKRVLTTMCSIVVQKEHDLIDSDQIKEQIDKWPALEKFAARCFFVPPCGRRDGVTWRVSRATEGESDVLVQYSVVEKNKMKMNMNMLRKKLGSEVLEWVCFPKSVGEMFLVVASEESTRAVGMPTYEMAAQQAEKGAEGGVEGGVGAGALAGALAVSRIDIKTHGANWWYAEEEKEGAGENASHVTALCCSLRFTAERAEAERAEAERAEAERAEAERVAIRTAHLECNVSRINAKVPSVDAMTDELPQLAAQSREAYLISDQPMPSEGDTAVELDPDTQAAAALHEVPRQVADQVAGQGDGEGDGQGDAERVVDGVGEQEPSKPDEEPTAACRLSGLDERMSVMRSRCTIDQADAVFARFSELMKHARPKDATAAAEAAACLFAQAESEVAHEESNKVVTADVDALEASVQSIVKEAIDKAEKKVNALQARLSRRE